MYLLLFRYLSPQVYPAARYPTIVTGSGYILTGNTTKILANATLGYTGNYIYLEDVFFTGILANESRIEHPIQFRKYFCDRMASVKCSHSYLTVHYVPNIKQYFEEDMKSCGP